MPAIVGLLFGLPFMLVYGQSWFSSSVTVSAAWVLSLIPFVTNIQYLFIGWTIVLLLVGLSTISSFSEGKSLLVILSGVSAVVLPVALIYIFLVV